MEREIQDTHRETAETIHENIDREESTEILNIEQTAEDIATLCTQYKVPLEHAQKSVRRKIETQIDGVDEEQSESNQNATVEIEREECSKCGGSGQITYDVMGHGGVKPCDQCDNIPKNAIPSNPPADPEAKIEELEGRIEEIKTTAAEMEQVQEQIGEVRENLRSVADSEFIDDDTAAIIDHIDTQIGQITHTVRPHAYRDQITHVRDKIRKTRRFKELLDERSEPSAE